MNFMRQKSLLALGLLFPLMFSCNTAHDSNGFVLSEDGKARAVIQVPEQCPPIVGFAAQELQAYLKKATGVSFSIQNGTSAVNGMSRIVLGDCEESRKAGLNVSTLPPDGFFIKQVGNTLYLCGHDDPKAAVKNVLYVWARSHRRGTLLAVYHLLKEYCGVRWLFPGEYGEYVPETTTLVLPVLSLREEPVMKMRICSPLVGSDTKALYGEGAKYETMLFLTRMGWSSWIMAKSHYFSYEYSASRWVETHPEYFAVGADGKRVLKRVPGQGWWLDFTNTDLADEVALDAIAYFKGEPASSRNLPERQFEKFGHNRESMAINAADTPIWSHNPECKKYRDKDGDYSELAWFYYKRISDKIARVCPGKILSVWSYGDHTKVPKSLKKAPDNTRIYIITSGPFDWVIPSFRKREQKRMKKWYAFSGHKMYLWVNFNIRACRLNILGGVPSPMTRSIGPWMKAVAPYMDGVYFANSSDIDLFEAANTYLYFHMAWDPTRDPEKILADYYSSSYGPAAKLIRSMEEAFEQIWLDNICTPRLDLGIRMLGVKASLPTTANIWEDIYTDERIAGFQKKMAGAVALAKGTPFEKRVGIFEKYYLGAVLDKKRKYTELLNLADDMRIRAARASKPIIVDGRIREKDWSKAEKGNMAVIKEGVKPNVDTKVRVLYDDENLYISWKCYEPEMRRLKTIATKHDEGIIWKDDEVEVFMDPSGKRRDYYQIMANAAGVTMDLRRINRKIDTKWESGAKTAVFKGDDYWSLEMAIPYTAMGVNPPKAGDSWVANLCRGRGLVDAKPGESQFLSWSKVLKDGFARPNEFGRIDFTEKGEMPEDKNNILKNGSFEDKTKGWGGKNCSIDTKVSWNGEKSIKLVSTDPDAPCAILQRLPGKIKTNTEYAFTYYIKVTDVNTAPGTTEKVLPGVGAEIHIPAGWIKSPHRFIKGTQDWRKYGVRFKTGEKINPRPTIRFQIRYATGTAWIDNVKLYEIKE